MRTRLSRRQKNRQTAGRKRLPLIALEGLEGRSLFSTTLTPLGDLVSPAPAESQAFGTAVATKGNLALVGTGTGTAALYDTTNNTLLGVYTDPTDPDGTLGHQFGASVTFFGDGTSFAIGAPSDGGGKVYVYSTPTSAATVLTAEAYIGYDPEAWIGLPGFGYSLAGYHGHLLVSTPNNALESVPQGTVQEIDPLGGGVIRMFTNPQGYYDDQFGDKIAVSGDQILFRSQPGQYAGVPEQSVVYLFDGSDFTNDQGQIRMFYDPMYSAPSLNFGWTMAFDGDRVVIGSPFSAYWIGDEGEFSEYGAPVYQFSASSGELVRTYEQPATIPTLDVPGYSLTYSGWGYGLAISGDRLLIGAPLAFNDALSGYAGQVYAYDLGTGEQLAHAVAPDENGSFGANLAALPGGRFVVADPGSQVNGFDAGQVHIYGLVSDNPPPQTSPPVAVAGDDQTVVIDQAVSFSGADSTADAGVSIVSYEWDFNYDGTNFDADASGVSSSYVYTATGTYTVALKVTDDHGKTSIDTVTVTVTLPPPPTADAGADASALNGQVVALNGSGTGALSYAWDFNYDGITFDADATGATASVVYTASGAHVVALRVTDAYGQYTIDTLVVTTVAPAPTADAGADQAGEAGSTLSFHGAGTAGTGSTVTAVAWDFNYDGITFDVDATGTDASHAYAAAGTYTVAFRVTTSDGQYSIDTMVVTVTTPAPPTPPVVVVGGKVQVTGTASDDTITLDHNKNGDVLITVNGVTYGPFVKGSTVVINGGAGNDSITGLRKVNANLEIYGGPGNDTITGGSGADILVGGDGDDVIIAGTGRDLIIGGTGSDLLEGKAGQDIVIAGSTVFDSNPTALNAILAEWLSGRTLNKRVANLLNGTGSADRLNGSYFLTPGVTVFDDAAVDTLSGGGGKDWLIFNATGTGVLDILTDPTGADVITDL